MCMTAQLTPTKWKPACKFRRPSYRVQKVLGNYLGFP